VCATSIHVRVALRRELWQELRDLDEKAVDKLRQHLVDKAQQDQFT
jgi:hypothetical protein